MVLAERQLKSYLKVKWKGWREKVKVEIWRLLVKGQPNIEGEAVPEF